MIYCRHRYLKKERAIATSGLKCCSLRDFPKEHRKWSTPLYINFETKSKGHNRRFESQKIGTYLVGIFPKKFTQKGFKRNILLFKSKIDTRSKLSVSC